MGLFDSLFGGGGDGLKKPIARMEADYAKLRGEQESAFAKFANQFTMERANNADVYSKQYNEAIGKYSDLMAQSRQAFQAAGAKAYETLASGRDATLQLLQQETNKAVGRQTLSGMLTGLSNTTFGQNAINAVSTQGALQAAAVKEQYAQTLANAQMAQATALAGMEQQTAQSLFGAGLNAATAQANIYNQYTMGGLQAQQLGLNVSRALGEAPIASRFGAKANQSIQQQQSQNAIGGALIGATGGLLGNVVGGLLPAPPTR
jgi:hypothetical protein